jgi:DNA-binding NarL/FixJ family response regulator
LFDEGARRDRTANVQNKTPWFIIYEAGLALEAGDVERAQAIHEAAPDDPAHARAWWWGLGLHLACRRGALDEAREQRDGLLGSYATVERRGADPQLVHDVVHAQLVAGIGAAEVRAFVARLSLGDIYPLPDDSAWRMLIEGQLLEAEQQLAEALAAYEAAIAAGDGVLKPSVLGSAHVGAARMAIALGQIDVAKDHAAAAEPLLNRWGGWRVAELVAVERRLGTTTGPDGPPVLTPREREVVALVGEGLSNGEIAARLYISPKTASVHVSNVLAKLGMASRAEIAAYAAREGITPPA